MEKFKFNGYIFDIIESFVSNDIEGDNEFEVKKTNKIIKKEVYPIFPIHIGGKFRWFKKCIIVYRLYILRKQYFNDEWTYRKYWGKWKYEWLSEEIIDMI